MTINNIILSVSIYTFGGLIVLLFAESKLKELMRYWLDRKHEIQRDEINSITNTFVYMLNVFLTSKERSDKKQRRNYE